MIKKILISLGIVTVILVLGVTFLWYVLGKVICEDDQFATYRSPNEMHKIVSYQRNCGATTPYVYNVELDGKNILRYAYGDSLSIEWIDDNHVSIVMNSLDASYLKVYRYLDNYKNIQIDMDQKIRTAIVKGSYSNIFR